MKLGTHTGGAATKRRRDGISAAFCGTKASLRIETRHAANGFSLTEAVIGYWQLPADPRNVLRSVSSWLQPVAPPHPARPSMRQALPQKSRKCVAAWSPHRQALAFLRP